MKTPVNDLERAFKAVFRSQSALPDFYRRLCEADLWFLMPFHPELDGGEMQIEPGRAISFESFVMRDKQIIPLFTSQEQLRYAVRMRKEWSRKYAVCQLKGVTLFQILATQPMTVVVNAHSEMGECELVTGVLKKLADGSMLKPIQNAGVDEGGNYTAQIMILDPAEYPTSLVQPVFEYIRQHEVFLAAWIFGTGGPVTRENGNFQIALWMERRDADLEQGLGVVLMALHKPDLQCELTVMSTAQTESQEWTKHVPPFYRRG